MSKKLLIGFLGIGIVGIVGGAIYWFSVDKNTTTDPTLKRIKDEGKIVIGSDATYAPMESMDENGKVIGFDPDIAEEIAAYLNVSAEVKNVVWDDIFTELNEGKVDVVISSVTINEERMKEMAFSDPYFNAGQVIVVLEEDGIIEKPADLEGKKVGVQKETTSEIEALKYTDASYVGKYEDYYVALEDLKAGEIDAIITDYPGAVGIIKNNIGIKIACDPFTQEFYGIAVRNADTALLSEINKVIRNLKQTGKLKDIERKWF